MAEVAGLIERVGKLDGPDREVDAEIDAALFGGRASHTFTEDCGGARLRKSYGAGTVFLNPDPNDNGGHVLTSHYRKAAEYTSSLDAAVALVERVLPGWYWRTGRTSLFPNGWAYISRTHPSHCDREDEASCADGKAANPAIALLLALLRALQSQEAGNGH